MLIQKLTMLRQLVIRVTALFQRTCFLMIEATTGRRQRLFKEYVDLRPWGFTVIDTGEACRILDHN